MAICLGQVLDYLDNHPVCQRADTVESVMKLLYDTYAIHNDGSSFRSSYPDLPASLYSFCARQEQQSFVQGVVVGMLLMTEVNSTL